MADPCSYEVIRKGEEIILKIDSANCNFPPSVEDSPACMSDTCDKLIEARNVTKIVFSEKRDYEYDYEQTRMLSEIAKIFSIVTKQKSLMGYGLISECSRCPTSTFNEIQHTVITLLRQDPIGCYVKLKRISRDLKIKLQKEENQDCVNCHDKYIIVLENLLRFLDGTKLISKAREDIPGFQIGDRTIYRRLFSPSIKPNFMFTKLMATYPSDAEELDSYNVGDTEVTIFQMPNSVKYLYHIIPPEFKLSEESYELLDNARRIMSEHKPQKQEFVDPERMREVFFNIGKDLLEELATFKGMKLNEKELVELTNILVRYTVGFGLIEVLLQDERIQDITINSPSGISPVFITHQKFDDCDTNIVPTSDETESWATKLRLMSGRPLDEANPILDTELKIPGAFSRVAVVTNPLNPSGLAFALRRHREKPWTLPLFIKSRTLNPLGAGIISFMVDGSRTMLIAGTRSSGKTSLLGAVMVEIMRRYRIITIEDSVTGDSEIHVKKNNNILRTTVGKLIDSMIEKYSSWYNVSGHEILGNDENFEILSMNKKGKVLWSRPSKLIRHKTNKKIYKITTRTGRNIKVTGDHSLFSLGKNAAIQEAKVRELKIGSCIAVPRKVPEQFKSILSVNLLDFSQQLEKGFIYGKGLKDFTKKNRELLKKIYISRGYNKITINRSLRCNILHLEIYNDVKNLGCDLSSEDIKNLKYKSSKNSFGIPVSISLSPELLGFCGLWIADGCYDKNSTIISVVEEENRELVRKIASDLELNIKMHSDTFSLMINSGTFKHVLQKVFMLNGNSYTKRVPEWVFDLSNEQISSFIRGIFSGDSCVSESEVLLSSSSEKLLDDVQSLLLRFGIILRIKRKIKKDNTYSASISALKFIKTFNDKIKTFVDSKNSNLIKLCDKISTHDTSGHIPLIKEDKLKLSSIKGFNFNDYITRDNNIGTMKMQSLMSYQRANQQKNDQSALAVNIASNIRTLLESDIYWDSIKDITIIENFEGFVYDFSVPESESFVCGNIIAHNTIELPSRELCKLGYNIQQLKVASALTKGTNEVAADEGIRTTLRLGDSSLIVGEVRSTEALALYEAMRVGALANVVAGTIHGDSAYGVFDRVVNDLGVPRTSFKATDAVIIANPIKSADGIHKWRRVTQITEVRKHWERDPQQEGGFVDLMKYDPIKDELIPSKDLLNGESDLLKSIASKVKEWAGNWDAVWENINLRADMKKAIVDISDKADNPDILEAKFVIRANDMFHQISDDVRNEVGSLDSKMIYLKWHQWLVNSAKKK